MGTRHLICAVKGGEYKIAQYGQWDGYPDGQGADVLEHLRNDFSGRLRSHLDLCRWITNEEFAARWKEFGVDVSKGSLVSGDISKQFYSKYPELHRDTGANILSIVANSNEPVLLLNDLAFAKSSLFCEWAYVIDFDKDVLEVYRGYNKEPLDDSERFSMFNSGSEDAGNTYYPIKLLASFSFGNLPTKEDFVNTCNLMDGKN